MVHVLSIFITNSFLKEKRDAFITNFLVLFGRENRSRVCDENFFSPSLVFTRRETSLMMMMMMMQTSSSSRAHSSSFTSTSFSTSTRGGTTTVTNIINTRRRRQTRRIWRTTEAVASDDVVDVVDATTLTQALPADFEAIKYAPSPLEPGALNAQFAVLGVVSITVAYWWFVVVPAARINLAVNKNQGKLKTYLEELKQDDSRKLERWFFTEWLVKIDPETKYLLREDEGERETDNNNAIKLGDTEGGGDKTKSEDIDIIIQRARKTPDFFSLDNPVLVAFIITFGFSAVIGLLGEVSAGVLEN